jgi:5S rRNA maturation endonuclease (ribonuclease M5)
MTNASTKSRPSARERVRDRLVIPSKNFLKRGFSREVLDAFDVGYSREVGYDIVPVYDAEGRKYVGCTGRSTRPYCETCRKHHRESTSCRSGQEKWYIQRGFRKSKYLYNHATARYTDAPFIFVVEGPPDVFRLAEAGHVGVAILGVDASDLQMEMLADLDKEIWLAFDNDKPGDDGRARFRDRLRRNGVELSAHDFRVPRAFKDVGETPVDELRRVIHEQVGEGCAGVFGPYHPMSA